MTPPMTPKEAAMTRAPHRPPLVVGPAALDRAGRRALIAGHVVHLPAQEAAILDQLMRHPGRVFAATELLAATGQSTENAERLPRLMRRLTRRLEVCPLLPPLIERVEPTGYRFTTIGARQANQS
jgi:two-component system KDP operon response regulator KdpE